MTSIDVQELMVTLKNNGGVEFDKDSVMNMYNGEVTNVEENPPAPGHAKAVLICRKNSHPFQVRIKQEKKLFYYFYYEKINLKKMLSPGENSDPGPACQNRTFSGTCEAQWHKRHFRLQGAVKESCFDLV